MRGWLALLTALFLVLAGCGGAPPASSSPEPPTSLASSPVDESTGEPQAIPRLRNLFHEPNLFAAGNAAPAVYELSGRLTAGMVPHHLLASDLIAGFFLLAAQSHAIQPYDGVLLVSPSHFPENCNSDAVTALAGWSTHLGSIEPDTALVEGILADPVLAAENNPKAVEQDHGAAGLTPYIRQYLPDLPLAVCLLSNKLSDERLRAFQDTMVAVIEGRNVLVIASADCSHYRMPDEAALHDLETIEAVTKSQRARLLAFDDRNIDSPQAVTSFLRAAQATGGTVTLLGQSSSGKQVPELPIDPREGVTTYLVFAAA